MKLNFMGINKFFKQSNSDHNNNNNNHIKNKDENDLDDEQNKYENDEEYHDNNKNKKNKSNNNIHNNNSSLSSDSDNNNSENNSDDDSDSGDIFVVNEHERWRNDLGWSYRNLEMGDPKRYVSKLHSSDTAMEAVLPPEWQYVGKWKVDTTVPGSDSGWLYAYDFRTLDVREDKAGNANQRHYVRRKRWIRRVTLVVGENALIEDESRDDSTISDNIEGGGYAHSIISTTESLSFNQIDSLHHSASNELNNENLEEDDDEDETDEEIFKVLTSETQNNIPILKDQRLLSIGKKMKALEAECQKDDEQKLKDFHQNIEPSYKKTIKELDQRIAELRKKIQSELMMGDEHIALLEKELQAHVEVQDSTKRSLYFPNSTVTLGTGGVYFALDDFWLEYGSGQFIVDLVPSKETPQIIVLLTGAADGNDSGVAIRLKIGGFKLRGDSGKGVPRLSLDTVKVTATIRVTVMLTYNMKQKTWTSPANNFRVEMLHFKGPFGLSRSVVSGILTIVVPILREQLLKILPPELGMFISSLPSPLSVRGEFNVTGTELKHMSHAMFKSEQMCSLVGYTPEQLLKWIAIQKSIGRTSLIKTMQELLKYRRLGTTHHKQWDELRLLWNQAAIIYFDKTNADQNQEFPISFERILQGTDEILRNPIKIKFTLHNCDGQISVRSLIDNTQLFFERWRANSKDNSQDIGQLVMLLQKFNQQLDLAREALALTTEHLDFVNLRLALSIIAGSKGEIGVTISDILAQVPLALWTAMPKDLSFGFASPVPFLTTIRPQSDGSLNIEVLHCGKEIQHRATFYEWENKVGRNKPQIPPSLTSKKKKKRPIIKAQNSSSSDMFHDNLSEKDQQNSFENLSSPSTPVLSIPSMSRETTNGSITSETTPSKQNSYSDELNESNHTPNNHNIIEGTLSNTNLSSTPPKPDLLRNISAPKAKDSNDLPRESTSSMISTFSTSTTTTKTVRRQSLFSSLGYSTPQTTTQITQSSMKSKSTGIKFSKKKKVDETMSSSEKQRIELERTLATKPHEYEAHTIMNIKVFRPHVSIIVDKPVSLKPGSELFTFRVGPLERGWRPFGYDPNQTPAHARSSVINRHPSVLALSRPSNDSNSSNGNNKSDSTPPDKKLTKKLVVPSEGFDDDDEAEGGPEVIPLDGCPLLLQTSRHIKILAQVPNVQVNIYLAKLLKFFSLYFEDIDRLRKYLGVVSERAKEQTEEYIYLFKVLLDRLGKYLLLPNLDLSLNLSIKIVATDNDVNLSFETATNNVPSSTSPSSPSQSNNTNTLKLAAKVNVMDVLADSIAIKNSLLRCAQIYEKYCAEDAALEEARKLAEEDEYEDVDEDENDNEEEEDNDESNNKNLKNNNDNNNEDKGDTVKL